MPGGWMMTMVWMRMLGQTWTASAAMFLLMWLAMMLAMMLPSALPMLLSYRRTQYGRGAIRLGVPTLAVAIGYFFIWLLIGTLVYPIGVAFALATMRSSGLSDAEPVLAAAVLIIAGTIQFTSWKMRWLRRCRDPQTCTVLRMFGKNRTAWRYGLSQGISCAICCLGPMAVLLALGVMNLVVMAILTVVMAMEQLLPKPEWVVRISGMAIAAAGLFMMVRSLF